MVRRRHPAPGRPAVACRRSETSETSETPKVSEITEPEAPKSPKPKPPKSLLGRRGASADFRGSASSAPVKTTTALPEIPEIPPAGRQCDICPPADVSTPQQRSWGGGQRPEGSCSLATSDDPVRFCAFTGARGHLVRRGA